MKKLIVLTIAIVGLLAVAARAVWVDGYFRADGTFVPGHYRADAYQGSSWGGSNAGTVVVDGYTKKNGTVVSPYMRSPSNGTQWDNYGTRGNANPYTGWPGSRRATR